MRVRRMYASHRRAWTPRMWPIALVDALVVVAANAVVSLSIIGAVVLGVGVGAASGHARWALWRRRHPIISVDEYITDLLNEQRRHARWN